MAPVGVTWLINWPKVTLVNYIGGGGPAGPELLRHRSLGRSSLDAAEAH